ncbi:putative fibronectin type 3 and ankyrin repeat domains 1 protein [Apostichopus japonicus]|uniref:Putative fibronectin type 3 and ankyrin repeat domains 1 protein n=1 Tax=Stichopus japonicus TaxID=307972 RepID=A0A2G8L3Y4_STIJA|nr:putative fibronectin type 3 and ankyrin repeat domains 1 protein [Apostichopus japonicus]
MSVAPKRPDPPVVGKVTHHSIELYWESAGQTSDSGKGDGRLRFCLQEADKSQGWGNVHIGASSGEQLHRIINLTQDIDKLKKILETGDNLIDVPDKFGYTPLMVCAQKGLTNIIEVLLPYGADVNAQNSSGKDAMMLASFAGHLEVVQLLRANGARYDHQDKGGSTSLHWAVDAGHLKLVKWMIRDGAAIDVVDFSSKWTPLMRCCAMSGHVEVARELFFAGAEVEKKDKDGKTALMIAALNGHRDLVQLLVERGADPFMSTEFGMSALDMARSFDKKKVVQYLEGVMEKSRKEKRRVTGDD